MKKILGFIFGIVLASCAPKIVQNVDKGDIMVITMNGKYSIAQFDSMCVADTIPSDLEKWKAISFIENETNAINTLFLYMKLNGRCESVYKVENIAGDSVKITKRITKD